MAASNYVQRVAVADAQLAEKTRTETEIDTHGPALWQALIADLTGLVEEFNTAVDPDVQATLHFVLAPDSTADPAGSAYLLTCNAGAGQTRTCKVTFDGHTVHWTASDMLRDYPGDASLVTPGPGDVRFSRNGKFVTVQGVSEALFVMLLRAV